ncbi:uncharacterized protein LOC127858376 [Dreissena polymorpha]|uniref:uncharacterized protein LOC127858376 n=1 Tax=Dreissena polymorpha TaxID=45954 RepID=UPI002263EBDC|nr:uncharacterized protein LOC127858376 [Dreissena polymorpha]XP_052251429.1 uncharacterized protein LOC127858376 [Dreissena polymorpha]
MSGNNLQIQCCDSNLCNHGHTSSGSGSVLTTGTVAPTHSAQSTSCAYKVADGSFEGNGWSPWINGFATKTGDAQDGNKYISVTKGGAYQNIVFNGLGFGS